jgi:hypothetical protein
MRYTRFISGLVGIGGAIIIYPAILLLPPLFGAPAYSAYITNWGENSDFFLAFKEPLKVLKKTWLEVSPDAIYALYAGAPNSGGNNKIAG